MLLFFMICLGPYKLHHKKVHLSNPKCLVLEHKTLRNHMHKMFLLDFKIMRHRHKNNPAPAVSHILQSTITYFCLWCVCA